MPVLRLRLLRERVDVAEAALEGAALEERGGAGEAVAGVDRVDGVLDRVGAGEAHRHLLIDRRRLRTIAGSPDGVERSQEIEPGRLEVRFGKPDLRLGAGAGAQHRRTGA